MSSTGSGISIRQLFLSLKNKTNKERDHLSHIRKLLFFNLFSLRKLTVHDCGGLARS